MSLLAAGDSALVAEYGTAIDAVVNGRVRRLDAALTASPVRGVVETVPTYRSLMVHYDPMAISRADVERWVLDADSAVEDAVGPASRIVVLPVAYGGAFGPDLADVAAHAGLTDAEVVTLHAAGEYPVYMVGFMPGLVASRWAICVRRSRSSIPLPTGRPRTGLGFPFMLKPDCDSDMKTEWVGSPAISRDFKS